MSCKGSKKYCPKTYKPKEDCQIAYVGSCGYSQKPGGMVPREGCNPAGGVTPQMVAKSLSIALSGPMVDFGFTFTGALLGRHAASRLIGYGPFGSSQVTLPAVLSAFQKALAFFANGGFGGAFMKLLTCPDSSLGDADCVVTTPSCCSTVSTSSCVSSSSACNDCESRQEAVFDIKSAIYTNSAVNMGFLQIHGGIMVTGGVITLPCKGCYVLRYLITAADATTGVPTVTSSGSCNVVNNVLIPGTTTYILGQAAIKNCGDGSCTVSINIGGTLTITQPSLVFIHRYGTC